MKLFNLFVLCCICFKAFAITLCQPPATGGQYENSQVCVKGQIYPHQNVPFGALLQPQLEQDDFGYMATPIYRQINYPANQAYFYQLNDGPIKSSSTIEFTPIINQQKASIAIKLPKELTFINGSQGSCQQKSSDTLICQNFNDFLAIIKPIFQMEMDDSAKKGFDAIEKFTTPVLKASIDTNGKPFLSLRYVHICSGSLISDKAFITAGHCLIDSDSNDPNKLLLNSITRNSVIAIGNNWQQTNVIRFLDSENFNVSQSLPHAFFPSDDKVMAFSNEQNISYDAAILPLKAPITDVSPAILQKAPFNNETQTYVAGFGMTEPFIGQKSFPSNDAAINQLLKNYFSVNLLYGKASFIEPTTCLDNYSDAKLNFKTLGGDGLICAGKSDINDKVHSEVAFCEGDSGGPLFFQNNKGQYVLVGLVSRKGGLCQNTFRQNQDLPFYPAAGLYAPISKLCKSDFFKPFSISCQ